MRSTGHINVWGSGFLNVWGSGFLCGAAVHFLTSDPGSAVMLLLGGIINLIVGMFVGMFAYRLFAYRLGARQTE